MANLKERQIYARAERVVKSAQPARLPFMPLSVPSKGSLGGVTLGWKSAHASVPEEDHVSCAHVLRESKPTNSVKPPPRLCATKKGGLCSLTLCHKEGQRGTERDKEGQRGTKDKERWLLKDETGEQGNKETRKQVSLVNK